MRAPKETIDNARRLRRSLSPPEARLWVRLRARVAGRPTFRRQHPIGPCVLDFYSAKARPAVEIDGIGHDMGDRPQRDLRRDAWLRGPGIAVVRIPASDVMRAADAIMREAAARIAGEAPSTALRAVPLPRGAGEDGA
jgi:very-short-patch-repair endonuclease